MKPLCERCRVEPCLGKWKYCRSCKDEVMGEMRKDGYLQTTYGNHHAGERRTTEMKENVYETIHGTYHG